MISATFGSNNNMTILQALDSVNKKQEKGYGSFPGLFWPLWKDHSEPEAITR